MNQRPSGLSHMASSCLPLRNIVALLAWSASHCSLFLHLSVTPSSATGGGVSLRPNERSSSCHNPSNKKRAGLLTYSLWLRRLDLNQRPSGYEPDELPTAPLRDIRLLPFLKVLDYYIPFSWLCQYLLSNFFSFARNYSPENLYRLKY